MPRLPGRDRSWRRSWRVRWLSLARIRVNTVPGAIGVPYRQQPVVLPDNRVPARS